MPLLMEGNMKRKERKKKKNGENQTDGEGGVIPQI
jgi:hypothetical protein